MTTLSKSALASLALGLAAAATAQPEEKPLLSGPEVRETRPALVEERFGGEKSGRDRMGAVEAVPLAELRAILRALSAEETDPTLRLTPEQTDRARELMRAFESERRAYILEHRAELAALRQAAGQRPSPQAATGREPGSPTPQAEPEGERSPQKARNARPAPRPRVSAPEADAPMPPEAPSPEREDARRKIRDLMQAGPSTADLQRRIYAELTEAQLAFIDAEILRRAEEQAQKRDRATLERRRADRAQNRPSTGREPTRQPRPRPSDD